MNNSKEYLKKPAVTEEDIKYRQGRRKDQVEGHTIMAFISILGIVIMLWLMIWLAS
jgi:hypothetical protein